MTVESWDIATLLMDANVMIDLRETDNYDIPTLLAKTARVAIVEQTRQKVSGLTPTLCRRLKIDIIKPDTDEILLAADLREQTKQLAEDDALTLAVAHEQKMTVISNDRRVVETGQSRGIDVRREFFILFYLAYHGFLTHERCIKIAEDVISSNPWMSSNVLDQFKQKLQSLTNH